MTLLTMMMMSHYARNWLTPTRSDKPTLNVQLYDRIDISLSGIGNDPMVARITTMRTSYFVRARTKRFWFCRMRVFVVDNEDFNCFDPFAVVAVDDDDGGVND